MFFDNSDSDRPKGNTIEEIVKAGLTVSDSDDLSEGSTNLYMTAAERSKLS
jgi:hypothetical protein